MRSRFLSVRATNSKSATSRFIKIAIDVTLSIVEAAAIIIISQVGFIFFCIKHFLSNLNTWPTFDQIKGLVLQTYGYGDLFGLLSGLFASSVVFFIINYTYFTNRPAQLLFFAGGPLLLLALVSPIQTGATSSTLSNTPFVVTYAAIMTVGSFVFWVFCLWRQRTLDDAIFDPNRGVRQMMEGVE